MQTELECNENSKLGGRQLFAIQAEDIFSFLCGGHKTIGKKTGKSTDKKPVKPRTHLNQTFQRFALYIVQFGAEQQTSAGAQFPIALVDQIRQDQLLKVHVRLGHRQQIDTAVQLVDVSHFALQTAQFAERQLNVRKFLAELVV